VSDAQAALSVDETNLSKASIRAPADGVVLTRSVDPGNAVAASLQAVTLFTIAEDLKQLRLQVNIDEADVGAVNAGQNATFTVSAYPARAYPARITRVAFGSTTTDNVVTYLTYLDVDNTDLSLRPGMTATATIAAVQHDDVLRVPNSALRFAPSQATAAASSSSAGAGRSIVSSLVPQRPPGGGGRRATPRSPDQAGAAGVEAPRKVWIVRDGVPQPVAVRTGISDGRQTEIIGGDLQPGMQVITDQKRAAAT
jgi:HlyD family secretion protein